MTDGPPVLILPSVESHMRSLLENGTLLVVGIIERPTAYILLGMACFLVRSFSPPSSLFLHKPSL